MRTSTEFCWALLVLPSVVAFTAPLLINGPCKVIAPHCFGAPTTSATGLQASPSSLNELQRELNRISQQPQPQEQPSDNRCIHPATIDALTHALQIRAQNIPEQPLRWEHLQQRHYSDDDAGFEIYLTAGRIAQAAVQPFLVENQDKEEEELWQNMAGRIVAILTRLDDLEWELQHRCRDVDRRSDLGLLDSHNDEQDGSLIDAALLNDPALAKRRATSLLALFLELVERPSLLARNEVAPKVDFLEPDLYDVLFAKPELKDKSSNNHNNDNTEKSNNNNDSLLHPIALKAIVEALQLRARNETTNPLRILEEDDNNQPMVDNWEVQMAASRLVTRYLQQEKLSPEDQSTLGGRILMIIMRMEDLEWELQTRITKQIQAAAATTTTTTIIPSYADFGLLPDESCIRSLDERLLDDASFCQRRAEGLLALFLWLLERPDDLRIVDFLDEQRYQWLVPTGQGNE